MHHKTWNLPTLRGLCIAAAAVGIGLASAPVTAGGGSDRGVWHLNSPIGQDGNNVAFFAGAGGGVGNSLAQDLGHAIVGNSTYTVEFLFGAIGLSAIGVVELYAGGTVSNGVITGGTLLHSLEVTPPFPATGMTMRSFDWSSPLGGQPVGENLSIRLASVGGINAALFDNFQVSYAPIPEPASAALLLAGLGTLLWFRRLSGRAGSGRAPGPANVPERLPAA